MDDREDNLKILQIIPAQTGWQAVYAKPMGLAKDGRKNYFKEPLVCWALVEADYLAPGEVRVIGMVLDELHPGQLALATLDGFIGYEQPGSNYDWEAAAKAWDVAEPRKLIG